MFHIKRSERERERLFLRYVTLKRACMGSCFFCSW